MTCRATLNRLDALAEQREAERTEAYHNRRLIHDPGRLYVACWKCRKDILPVNKIYVIPETHADTHADTYTCSDECCRKVWDDLAEAEGR